MQTLAWIILIGCNNGMTSNRKIKFGILKKPGMIVHLLKVIIHLQARSARNKLVHTFLLVSLYFMHCKKFI